MTKQSKICCFISREKVDDNTEVEKVAEITEKIALEIYDAVAKGYTHFISGVNSFYDMVFAQAITMIKEIYGDNITLECATPHPLWFVKWRSDQKEHLKNILKSADSCIHTSTMPFKRTFEKHCNYMLENSSLLIILGDGKNKDIKKATDIAMKKGVHVSVVI